MKLADGFENAFVGSSISAFNREQVAIYDYEECIAVLIQQDMSEEDAVEHFQYNVIGSWVGEDTPVFINMHGIAEVEDYLEE
jgi:hypothetical protein